MARLRVTPEGAGSRLDRWLAAQEPALSRARLQALIADGHVLVGGRIPKPSYRLREGDEVTIEVPPAPPEVLEPEPIALAIVFEDEQVLVVDKPSGMVVHPGAGHARATLAAAVLAHAPGTAGVGGPRRPGVVHRLDKDTSGLLVIAKTQLAYESLTRQLAARTVGRRYVALVQGAMSRSEGVVDAPIGRHPHDRIRMAIRPAGRGKRAVTRYRLLERFSHYTWIEARLETGRTHQIRVHMASLGHPVVGDRLYGGGDGNGRRRGKAPMPFEGLALHAAELAFVHPATGTMVEFTAPLPPHIVNLLSHIRDADPR
jgi:23S rRNA pseudouridine1911/1915/1917 synthase